MRPVPKHPITITYFVFVENNLLSGDRDVKSISLSPTAEQTTEPKAEVQSGVDTEVDYSFNFSEDHELVENSSHLKVDQTTGVGPFQTGTNAATDVMTNPNVISNPLQV